MPFYLLLYLLHKRAAPRNRRYPKGTKNGSSKLILKNWTLNMNPAYDGKGFSKAHATQQKKSVFPIENNPVSI